MRILFILAISFSLLSSSFWLINHESRVVGDTGDSRVSGRTVEAPPALKNPDSIPGVINSKQLMSQPELDSTPEKCVEDSSFKIGQLSAKPDPMFGALLASNSAELKDGISLEEVSKCALSFTVKNGRTTFLMQAGNLEVEAKKISVTGSNALLTVVASQGELLVTNKNMQATCSKFEIKLPYCGPQNGKLYVTARDNVAYFSCDGLYGDFERLTLNSGKVKAELTVDNNHNLLVKLGDAQLKCKSIALELADGQILMDNEIDWQHSGIDLDKLGK